MCAESGRNVKQQTGITASSCNQKEGFGQTLSSFFFESPGGYTEKDALQGVFGLEQ